ncbi:MAG: class I SAM-dependent methyltransferase, partial [Oligoflexia bacterium]|nr:class I SAM-dependent methyltransferase [Oligoflexia bacterium]
MGSKHRETAAQREARLASVVELWLQREGLPAGVERVLVVDDDDGGVERAVEAAGGMVQTWRRRATGQRAAAPWPKGGTAEPLADLAILRLPRDWAASELQVHAALSRLRAGGQLWVVGANDEGIKSAPGHLAWLGEAQTLWIKKRVRILAVGRPAHVVPRGGLEAWREAVTLDLPGAGSHTLASYPGLFAHGRLDEGSRLLLEVLASSVPLPRPGERVLDFGCGAGTLAVALAARQPDARYYLTDVDAIATTAARQNLPGATVRTGDAWASLDPDLRFHLILSNPPLHRGHASDRDALDALLQQAPGRLLPGGRLVLVTWKAAAVGPALGQTPGKTPG